MESIKDISDETPNSVSNSSSSICSLTIESLSGLTEEDEDNELQASVSNSSTSVSSVRETSTESQSDSLTNSCV